MSLTFYTDEAAWQAAVSGDTIGQLTDPATMTRQQTIVQLNHDGTCCLQDIHTTQVSQTPFTSLTFTAASVMMDSGWPSPIDTEVVVDLPVGIDGFAVEGVFMPMNSHITLNGQVIVIPNPTQDYVLFPFLGVVGDITSLDFLAPDACVHCDYPFERMQFSNIVVAQGGATLAQVQEPIMWPLLMLGLVTILFVQKQRS